MLGADGAIDAACPELGRRPERDGQRRPAGGHATAGAQGLRCAPRHRWDSRRGSGGAGATLSAEAPRPVNLDGPALFDTGVWTWARDRRFPHLAEWFNNEVEAGRVLVCDLVVLELTRLAPNEDRAHRVA